MNEKEVERKNGEDQMLESKKNIKLEQMLLREEWGRVTPREINLKEKEKNFDMKKRRGEVEMLESKRNLEIELMLLRMNLADLREER